MRHRPLDPAAVRPLHEGWTFVLTSAGACQGPAEAMATAGWSPAVVPGTVAAAKAALGERFESLHLDHLDAWYRTTIEGSGRHNLAFEGLATLAEVYLDGGLILSSDNMFHAHAVEVSLAGRHELAIVFRAMQEALGRKGKRARWRPQMIPQQGMRLVRSTLLGRMPGWCPEIHAVGPWRPVTLTPLALPAARDVRMIADLDGDVGRLSVSLALDGADSARLHCAGDAVAMEAREGRLCAMLDLPGIAPWWPHTHGTPALHEVFIETPAGRIDLGRTGFRRITVDRGADGSGFGLLINGEPVFCRGACWTTPDIRRLPGDRESYAPWLALAREAGMNMLRVGGTMAYESPAFFALCDELGILVFADFMFANFDYPAEDEAFAASVTREAEDFLGAIQGSPALAVLCGGSEISQQAAMMGLPPTAWSGPLIERLLPDVAARLRPDVPYVPNSPCGGALPFQPGAGIAHYYGVGAYERPLEDARRADVRFAAECLAFSNVPQQETLDAHLPVAPGHHPRWKAAVPRDNGASWDFEDTREHYLGCLYGVDPARLRREDPARWLDLSRAVTGDVMEETFAEWRRAGSSCRGALVWTFQDLVPGAGWGVVDSTGAPKPAWYALTRAFRPVQVVMTDEGTNGLLIHCINETGQAIPATLEFACLREGTQPVVARSREMVLEARSTQAVNAVELIGAFFDVTYAFRFGPPSHDVTVARLVSADGAVLAEAFHFPLGRAAARGPRAITHSIEADGADAVVTLRAERFTPRVHIACPGFRAQDDWFHLAPGRDKRVRLRRLVADAALAVEIS